ncbi:NAD(P)-dependent oxidoreductase [soil metagenome]
MGQDRRGVVTVERSRTLITGGTGFLGGACVRHLVERGEHVHVLSRSDVRKQVGVTWLECDLRDEQEVARIVREVAPSRVLHLAWHVRAPLETSGDYQASSAHDEWVAISSSLFSALSDLLPRPTIVAAGSAFEYGSPERPVSEEATVHGALTNYAARKRETLAALRTIAGEGRLRWSWSRLFPLYGGGESPGRLLARVTRALLVGEHVACNHSLYVRDLVLNHDAAYVLAALLDSPANDVVNVGSGNGHILRNVLVELAGMLGATDLLSFEAGGYEVGDTEPAVLVADVERQRRVIGFVPSTPLSQGLAQTIDYWRRHASDG